MHVFFDKEVIQWPIILSKEALLAITDRVSLAAGQFMNTEDRVSDIYIYTYIISHTHAHTYIHLDTHPPTPMHL